MKTLLILFLLGGTVIIHPTIPGSDIRDFGKPSRIIQNNGASYYTIPGTDARDFSRGGYFDNRTFQYRHRIDQPQAVPARERKKKGLWQYNQ